MVPFLGGATVTVVAEASAAEAINRAELFRVCYWDIIMGHWHLHWSPGV